MSKETDEIKEKIANKRLLTIKQWKRVLLPPNQQTFFGKEEDKEIEGTLYGGDLKILEAQDTKTYRETLKEVGEWLDAQNWSYDVTIQPVISKLLKALLKGEMPKTLSNKASEDFIREQQGARIE